MSFKVWFHNHLKVIFFQTLSAINSGEASLLFEQIVVSICRHLYFGRSENKFFLWIYINVDIDAKYHQCTTRNIWPAKSRNVFDETFGYQVSLHYTYHLYGVWPDGDPQRQFGFKFIIHVKLIFSGELNRSSCKPALKWGHYFPFTLAAA